MIRPIRVDHTNFYKWLLKLIHSNRYKISTKSVISVFDIHHSSPTDDRWMKYSNTGDGKVSMGWRSVVHPLMNPCYSVVGVVTPGTVECVSATQPRQTCRGNLESVVSVSGVGFSLLVLSLDHLVFPPFLPHVCLPVDHGPRVTSVVLPVNHVAGFAFVLHISYMWLTLHLLIHVSWLDCLDSILSWVVLPMSPLDVLSRSPQVCIFLDTVDLDYFLHFFHQYTPDKMFLRYLPCRE